jgi:hypothetical protein
MSDINRERERESPGVDVMDYSMEATWQKDT